MKKRGKVEQAGKKIKDAQRQQTKAPAGGTTLTAAAAKHRPAKPTEPKASPPPQPQNFPIVGIGSEPQVRAARGFAESMVQTVREPLVILDQNLQIESANRSFYNTFHLTPKISLGSSIFELCEGAWDIPKLRSLLQEILAANTSFDDFEIEKEFQGLGRRTLLLNGRAILDEEGRPAKVLLALQDFSERKKLENRLRETIQELEAFSYSVSHDLRAPLRAMLGFASIVLEENDEPLGPATRDYLQRILGAATRLEQLVQDILAYSRAARAEVHLGPINLENLIDELIHENPKFQPPAAEIKIARPLPAVVGHKASLSQCISNLMGNAVKFVAAGVTPRVKIRTEARQGQVRIWFEDNGIGLEPADQERIFSMFERVHSSEQYEGTGVGLAIVRKAVERMGGEVGVESELGQGSQFWLQLSAVKSI